MTDFNEVCVCGHLLSEHAQSRPVNWLVEPSPPGRCLRVVVDAPSMRDVVMCGCEGFRAAEGQVAA